MALPETGDSGKIRVYSRPGCHLCELLIDELLPLIRDRGIEAQVRYPHTCR
jgi:hypothetical protein